MRVVFLCEFFSTQVCRDNYLGLVFRNVELGLLVVDLDREGGCLGFLLFGYWINIHGPCELVVSVKEDACNGFEG